MTLLLLQRIRRGHAALETTEPVASSASSLSSFSFTPRPSRASYHMTTFVATTLMGLLLALQLMPEACAWRVPFSPASCMQCTPPRTSLSRTTPLFSTLPDQQQPPQDEKGICSSTSSSSEAAVQTSPSLVQVQSFSPFLGRQKRRPGLLFEEEIDFCLAIPTLEGVSVGNSNVEISKVVNTFANQAAKKILIGFDCCFGDLADAVKERLRAEYLEGGGEREDPNGGESRMVVEGACGFIDAVRFVKWVGRRDTGGGLVVELLGNGVLSISFRVLSFLVSYGLCFYPYFTPFIELHLSQATLPLLSSLPFVPTIRPSISRSPPSPPAPT